MKIPHGYFHWDWIFTLHFRPFGPWRLSAWALADHYSYGWNVAIGPFLIRATQPYSWHRKDILG